VINIPLTLEQLLAIFEAYNIAIWPMQVLAYVLGLVAVYFTWKRIRYSNSIISAILAVMWLWTGIVFCTFYWAPAYGAAYGFAVLLIAQGILFSMNVFTARLSYHLGSNVYSVIGILFILYAMVGYPVVGYFLGHIYPRALPFGLAPCPTSVFTFGLFMLTDKKVPKSFLVIPLLLAISAFVPVSIGILEDIGLIIAGLVGIPMILLRDRKSQG
jgi:hypothetical protein